jgi:hypothetical protein
MTSDDLPAAIALYLNESPHAVPGLAARCFTADARVHDEGRIHQGHAAIDAWMTDTARRYRFRRELLDATHDGDSLVVATRVSGDFPGSPVRLAHRFRMRGDRIDTLEIA